MAGAGTPTGPCTTVSLVKIAVLGGGSWGTTVASLVAPRHDTLLWARDPEVARAVREDHENPAYLPGFGLDPALGATADLEQAVCGADLVVLGVPTSGLRRVLGDAAPFMRPWIPVVSLSKGLERGSHLRMTEVIKEVVPGHPVAALTGPNIASEILSGKAAAAVIATEDLEVASAIQAVFTRGSSGSTSTTTSSAASSAGPSRTWWPSPPAWARAWASVTTPGRRSCRGAWPS